MHMVEKSLSGLWRNSLTNSTNIFQCLLEHGAFLVAQTVKHLPAMRETWVWSLGWEELEKGKASHSSILAWRIPWTIQSMGSQRVGHDWVTFTFHFHAMEKEMATYSSTLAWKIPWLEEPGRLQSMGSQRVRHDWVTFTSLHSIIN